MMNLQIKFFQVGCGDAISIRFTGNDNSYHNILIDSGYSATYQRTIKKHIKEEILAKGEKIDLWVLTHIDKDHINGAITFLNDDSLQHNDIVIKFWYNYSTLQYPIPSNSKNIGYKEGITLRDKIIALAIPVEEGIANESPAIDIAGAKITVLSPDRNGLEDLKTKWTEEENDSLNKNIGSKTNDYSKYIEILAQNADAKEKHNDIANRSSIAFLFEYERKKILFAGDAHPSVMIKSIQHLNQKLNYPKNQKLKIDYFKLSHHGSKHNFSKELLDIIDCANFVVSTNGGSHNLPNKEVLAKILSHKRDLNEQIMFIFNYNNTTLSRIFEVDIDAKTKYNFECDYALEEQNAYTLSL